jgi:hypothetical protein
MERTAHERRRTHLRWWHHTTIVGVLGVGALYLVGHLYRGMLLYYAGPGDPLWLDDIILWWQIVFGALLGAGIGVWIPTSLKPSRMQPKRVHQDPPVSEKAIRVSESG